MGRNCRGCYSSGLYTSQILRKTHRELSFPQTPIMGRFGSSMTKPLYVWVNAHPYVEMLSAYLLDVLRWWAASLRASRPRTVFTRPSAPGFIIYTDAATSTRIISAIVISVDSFKSSGVSTNVLLRSPTPSGGRFSAKRAVRTFTV